MSERFEKIEYVLGFAFSAMLERVCLIRKAKPDWQRGRLNGLGGKIENENKHIAMVREFKEECGITTHGEQWNYFCRMEGDEFIVHCFCTVADLTTAKTVESERVEVIFVDDMKHLRPQMIENLPWLIYSAQNNLKDGSPLFLIASYP